MTEEKNEVIFDDDKISKSEEFVNPDELYQELIQCVQKYHPSDDISMIEKAYKVASEAHKNQFRKSGEPYIIHPLWVGIILADLEMDKETIVAGMLHDIGKLKLTSYINGQEQDPLVIEELKYVRMHSTLGYEELKGQGYSDFVLESILYHHENYDGSGYPSNKAGDDIPIGARILRVCDVYAALISDRPYRRGFDISSVMELMIDEVKNFDMQVFLAFQRVVHNGDGQNFYKRGGQHGIKEETGNRYEGHFTKRDGNP